MPKKLKKVDKTDKWYLLAKEQGYRSRAAFKLAQINKEFGILGAKSKVVLDLCAAPGGWAQIAAKCVAADAAILAVDLLPIRPIPRVRCIVGDNQCRLIFDFAGDFDLVSEPIVVVSMRSIRNWYQI